MSALPEEPKTKRRIVIHDDDRVELITEKIEHVTNAEAAIIAMRGSIQETPLLPFGTILARFNKKDTDYYVMTPPKRRSIIYSLGEEKTDRMYDIAFPWILFIIRFMGLACVDVYSYAAKKPITSMDDMLYRLCLPNCSEDGKRCMGAEFGVAVNADIKSSVNEKALAILHYFETSAYNNDLSAPIAYLPREMAQGGRVDLYRVDSVLSAWEKWTLEHASNWSKAVCDLSWEPYRTLKMIVELRKI